MKSNQSTSLVYSTESGRMCPECRRTLGDCTCKTARQSAVLGGGQVRVARQTKGRGGKCVTLVKGLALDAMALAVMGKQLRTACGSGGTVKDGVIEIQGDHCELVMDVLTRQGHQPKRVGG